jgi:hypothetical protein
MRALALFAITYHFAFEIPEGCQNIATFSDHVLSSEQATAVFTGLH